MFRILMVDDDQTFSVLTQEFLESRGFYIRLLHNAEAGLKAFQKEAFDLSILDVKMPFKDGFALARDLRDLQAEHPIIFLTGQSEREDRIKGFLAGADDYIVKPFSLEELYLRIIALQRRLGFSQSRKVLNNSYIIGRYTVYPLVRELHLDDRVEKLSSIEARLLQLFCEEPEGIIDRDMALKRIWADEDMLKGRSLNVYVSKLRNYLKDDPNIEILNVHGFGYQLIVRGS